MYVRQPSTNGDAFILRTLCFGKYTMLSMLWSGDTGTTSAAAQPGTETAIAGIDCVGPRRAPGGGLRGPELFHYS